MRVDDRCQAHRCAVVMWELRGSQRPDSPRGIAAPVFLLRWASLIGRTKRDSAARGPLQTAAAAQHRHGASGRQVWDQSAAGFSPPRLVASGFSRKAANIARLCAGLKRTATALAVPRRAPCRVRGASGSPRRSHIATDARCGQRASSVRKMRRRRGGPRRRRFATDVGHQYAQLIGHRPAHDPQPQRAPSVGRRRRIFPRVGRGRRARRGGVEIRRGGCDVASPHQTRDPSLPAQAGSHGNIGDSHSLSAEAGSHGFPLE